MITKPNILLIIADDMGYSDITCFGGEVQTPHIDTLAKSGIRATNFYVAPTCSPTRSMLLTGCDKTMPACLMAAATVNIPVISAGVAPGV